MCAGDKPAPAATKIQKGQQVQILKNDIPTLSPTELEAVDLPECAVKNGVDMPNKKHQRRNHMSKVGFVRRSIYEKGLKKMARALRNTVERRMSESRVRENLLHGLMRGG